MILLDMNLLTRMTRSQEPQARWHVRQFRRS
jgi:hypothetical protein